MKTTATCRCFSGKHNHESVPSHTPTPYEVDSEGTITKTYDDGQVVEIAIVSLADKPKEVWEANKTYIVRAVNAHEAHEELRELLKKVLQRSHVIDALLDTELLAFHAAIAKAEGR